MAENVEETLERVMEGLVKGGDYDLNKQVIDKALLILHHQRELMKLIQVDNEELKKYISDQRLEYQKRYGPVGNTRDHNLGADECRKELILMLNKLPCSSASKDKTVMEDLESLLRESPAARALFEEFKWPITKLLNPTSFHRSRSNATLQALMASIVLILSPHFDETTCNILPDALPFLIDCLTIPRTKKARRMAASTLAAMSYVETSKKTIGESGAIIPLIKLIQEDGDAEAEAAVVIFHVLEVVENRERVVSHGAVIAVMDAIRRRRFVDEMLRTLVRLSWHEKAVEEIKEEKEGMLQCLVMILREDKITNQGKEYCVTIIHKICEGDVTKINEVENARLVLESEAITGTEEAREKAAHLLSKLQDLGY